MNADKRGSDQNDFCITSCSDPRISALIRGQCSYRFGGYFDKAGHEFTEAQFHAFRTWEYCLFGSFGVLAVFSIPMALSKRSRREGAE